MAKREVVVVEKELPSLFCVDCKKWKETQERCNMFASVDGKPARPAAWRCPDCRGEGHAPVARGPVTQAGIALDEKYGPMRQVAEIIKELTPKSVLVRMECGHERATAKTMSKQCRCPKCRPTATAVA